MILIDDQPENNDEGYLAILTCKAQQILFHFILGYKTEL